MKNANIKNVKNAKIGATKCALAEAMGNNCQILFIAQQKKHLECQCI